jgi:predicted DNA binding CopG/RHH family protein
MINVKFRSDQLVLVKQAARARGLKHATFIRELVLAEIAKQVATA